MVRLLVLILALVFAVPATAQPQSVGRDADGYIRIESTPRLSVYRSKHYRIFTTLSRAQTQPYGRHMDALHEQYLKRFRGLNDKQFEPMPLYLFKTEAQYKRFLAEHEIDGTHSGGMFFVTHQLEGLATWVHRDNRRKTYEVLQHEGFHQFAWHAFGPRLPVWLNEGLAQYFEDAVLIDGRMSLGLADSAKIGAIRSALKERRLQPMTTLLDLTNERWAKQLQHDPSHSSLGYAQAWSLTYFLVHAQNGAHKAKLLDYLKRLSDGASPQTAERGAFGQSGFAGLIASWKRFAATQQADEVTLATDRLAFLGTGLRVLTERDQPTPSDLDELRQSLTKLGFKMRTREMGVTRELSAESKELYHYTRSDRDERAFVLLEPDRKGPPPRITAPGLNPQPTLIWYRDAKGGLVQEIVYR